MNQQHGYDFIFTKLTRLLIKVNTGHCSCGNFTITYIFMNYPKFMKFINLSHEYKRAAITSVMEFANSFSTF